MLKGTQPGVSSGTKCFLFLLMLAVFVWGFHTKLSHYRPSQSSSNSSLVAAKLLTDRSVEHSADLPGEDVAKHPVAKVEVPLTIQVVPFPQLELYQVELSLCSSCRYDSAGPNFNASPPSYDFLIPAFHLWRSLAVKRNHPSFGELELILEICKTTA